MKKDDFNKRMKLYEKTILGNKLDDDYPVFVRMDGKSFHTYTKQFKKPFDKSLSNAFQYATLKTCEETGQIIMAYSQSDEVTFLLSGWQKSESQIYFDGKVQKIVSVMSSIFTAYFNQYFNKTFGITDLTDLAFFDARVWNVPKFEVENVLIWRQQDAKRNSIQSLAQSIYSHTQLHEKNSDDLISMCINNGNNWHELPNIQKWGFVVKKEHNPTRIKNPKTGRYVDAIRTRWIIDENIPEFLSENKSYLKDIIYEGKQEYKIY